MVSFSLADSGYHYMPRPTGFACFALPSEVSLIQADHVSQGLLQHCPSHQQRHSDSTLLTKVRGILHLVAAPS